VIHQTVPETKQSYSCTATQAQIFASDLTMERATASKIDSFSVTENAENRNIEVFTLHLRTTTGKA
jgi:hypothetical protein